MSEGRITTELGADGGLAVVIDRPAHGNVLTPEMTDALAALFRSPPEAARFIVLSGAGTDFCAGRQSPMPPPDSPATASDIRRRVAQPVLDFYEIVRAVPLPVIGVVRGRAHGVGCAIAALCDVVLADDSADFAIPEMERDIPPLLVMTALAGRLPRAAIARMVLSRVTVRAEEAVAIGLAAEACTAGALEARLAAWRAILAGNSRTTLVTVKRFLNAAPDLSFALLKEHAAAAISAAVSERFVKKP